MVIIFVICTSILGLIFIPKIRASLKKMKKKKNLRSTTFGVLHKYSRRTSHSDSDEEGIKILSTPKAIEELEAENKKLKLVISGSGRRLSNPSNDLADVSRRFSQQSNASDLLIELDDVPEKRVSFNITSNNVGVEDQLDLPSINNGDLASEDEGMTNSSEKENMFQDANEAEGVGKREIESEIKNYGDDI